MIIKSAQTKLKLTPYRQFIQCFPQHLRRPLWMGVPPAGRHHLPHKIFLGPRCSPPTLRVLHQLLRVLFVGDGLCAQPPQLLDPRDDPQAHRVGRLPRSHVGPQRLTVQAPQDLPRHSRGELAAPHHRDEDAQLSRADGGVHAAVVRSLPEVVGRPGEGDQIVDDKVRSGRSSVLPPQLRRLPKSLSHGPLEELHRVAVGGHLHCGVHFNLIFTNQSFFRLVG
mmetsp:Transcript_14063/g.28053  ORF Transcript_14063/g.28053 Transcript_14063/m.28053 type:complete len:223 (-) Transcript_14063:1276-1944(-)